MSVTNAKESTAAFWRRTAKQAEQERDAARDLRQALFGEWDSGHTESYVLALEAYAAKRKELNGSQPAKQAHEQAKKAAMSLLQEKVAAGQGGR